MVVVVTPHSPTEGASALAVDDLAVLQAILGSLVQQVIDAPRGFMDKAMIASD